MFKIHAIRIIIYTICLIFGQSCSKSSLKNTQINIYRDARDSLGIQEILRLQKSGLFTSTLKNKTYQKLDKNSAFWIHLKLDSFNESHYLIIENVYLHYAKVYIKTPTFLKELHQVSYDKKFPFKTIFYRYPTWKISKSTESFSVFIKIKDNEPRTRLKMELLSHNDFLNKTQFDYFSTGIYLSFLCSLLLIIVFLSLIQQKNSLLWYAIYILFIMIEYLAAKGIGIQYLWNESSFLIHNIRSLSQTAATFTASLFFMHFYKYTQSTLVYRQIFKYISILTGFLLSIYLYKYMAGGMPYLYISIWIALKLFVVAFFIIHWILVVKKSIPTYLGISFSLPVIGVLWHPFYNPPFDLSVFSTLIIDNIFYIFITLEIVLVTYYIISEVVKGKVS